MTLAATPAVLGPAEGHSYSLGDGRLMRLLGTRYRRERGDFTNIGKAGAGERQPCRTRTS